MENWFRKFISRFRGEQPDRDLVLLNLTFNRQSRPDPSTFVGTANEWNPPRKTRGQEEDRLEREKWKFPPAPEPIEGRTCGACGGKLVLVILNYHCEPWTDVIIPADKAEKCVRCGRLIEL